LRRPICGCWISAGRITDQRLAAFTDRELQIAFGRVALQAEHQPRHVAGNALEPRLAFAQGGQGAAALGDIGEEHHQVFGIAKAQKTQRQLHRQQAAVGARHWLSNWPPPPPRALPQLQPAVHVQAGLEVDQRPLQQLASA
jgi:hypothetical protein